MSDATLARMEHGKYVGVREESRRDGVCTLRKRTLYRRPVARRELPVRLRSTALYRFELSFFRRAHIYKR